jgi:hypothetical protein
LTGVLSSLGHNLIGNGTGGSGYTDTDLVGTSANPIDPRLGPLQDNGGQTPTMALLAGSPALNAGDPAELGVADQRGVVRSGGVNIGAYQASASTFLVGAADTVQAGVPFDVTVTAVDPFGQTALGYTGTVTFSSADPYGASLPADYTFTLADDGSHTFNAQAALYTAGTWDVTATDINNSNLTGSSNVLITPAPAVAFVLSPSVVSGAAFDLTVTAVDPYGNTDTNYVTNQSGVVTFSTTDQDPGIVLPPRWRPWQRFNACCGVPGFLGRHHRLRRPGRHALLGCHHELLVHDLGSFWHDGEQPYDRQRRAALGRDHGHRQRRRQHLPGHRRIGPDLHRRQRQRRPAAGFRPELADSANHPMTGRRGLWSAAPCRRF